eukprot:m.297200 g.297200  ORF g.297200 m.297200 type:complete len:87 (+) comp13558_c0_seq1:638-898(+)
MRVERIGHKAGDNAGLANTRIPEETELDLAQCHWSCAVVPARAAAAADEAVLGLASKTGSRRETPATHPAPQEIRAFVAPADQHLC